MKITLTNRSVKSNTIIFYYKSKMNSKLLYEICGLKKLPEHSGNGSETYSFINPSSGKKTALVPIGESDNAISLSRKTIFQALKLEGILVVDLNHVSEYHFEQIVYGGTTATYDLEDLKLEKKFNPNISEIRFFHLDKKKLEIFEKTQKISDSAKNIMNLVNLPSNIKTPYYIADYAQKSSKKYKYNVTIFRGEEVLKNKLHALYEVGKGSANPPAFIIMEYKPKGKSEGYKKIGLVGKGISFDTGGISIKPSQNMHYMKSDMSGAAAVIGIMEAAAQLELPYHIVGIVPTCENAVSGNAYRPGDIISSYSGKSIEVIDTDAEGRLILADGLAYMVKNHNPEVLIDFATLTGSCVATLGYFAAGLFTNNDNLAAALYESGQRTMDRVWRLPMWDDYKGYMTSDMADIKNLSTVPVAGATTAAKFLEAFTEKHQNWAHIDIAGVALTDNDIYKSRVATAFGLRLMIDFLEHMTK